MKSHIIPAIFIVQVFVFSSCTKDDSCVMQDNKQEVLFKKDGQVQIEAPHETIQGKDRGIILPGQYFYPNVTWTFPWYNTLEIPKFYNARLVKKPMKVFVRREIDDKWIEVPPYSEPWGGSMYEYFVVKNPGTYYDYRSLIIFYYGSDVSDTPDVKVVFS